MWLCVVELVVLEVLKDSSAIFKAQAVWLLKLKVPRSFVTSRTTQPPRIVKSQKAWISKNNAVRTPVLPSQAFSFTDEVIPGQTGLHSDV